MEPQKKDSFNMTVGDFVDIHGRELKVVISDQTGDILIPLCEIKCTGFNIFRKSQYDRLLVDESQFTDEFDLYMLESAKSYMLKNKITFREEDILRSINNCKQMLKTGFVAKTNGYDSKTASQSSPKPAINNNHPPIQSEQQSPRGGVPSPTSSVSNFPQRNNANFVLRKCENQAGINQQSNNQYRENSYNKQPDQNGEVMRRNSFQSNGPAESQPQRRFNKVDMLPPTITLTANEVHNVLVTHMDKATVAWVQDMDNCELLIQISELCEKSAIELPVVPRPVYNKVYIAMDDDTWFRCRVTNFNPLTVFFLDYGNFAEVSEVRDVPEDLAKIRRQAVRICFKEGENIKYGDELKIRQQKQFENGTYVVTIIRERHASNNRSLETSPKTTTTPIAMTVSPKTTSAPAQLNTPLKATTETFEKAESSTVKEDVKTTKVYTKIPKLDSELQNDQRILVAGSVEDKLILRNKECFDNFKLSETFLRNLQTEMTDALAEVIPEQLVIVPLEDGNLYRAVVKKVEGTAVGLSLLDFGRDVKISSEKLYNFTEDLSKIPSTYLISPALRDRRGKAFVEIEAEYIEELNKNKTKGIVVMNYDGFDIKFGDSFLSASLFELTKPKDGRVFLRDMEMYRPKFGLKECICYAFRDINDVTFVEKDTTDEEHLIKFDLPEVPYEPGVDEVCWGRYQGDFYRCVVVNIVNNKYDAFFIDFGNKDVLTTNDLRKLTDDAKKVPVVGLPCKIIGPSSIPNLDQTVKSAITEGETYEINIKSFVDGVYEVEVPSLLK